MLSQVFVDPFEEAQTEIDKERAAFGGRDKEREEEEEAA